MQSNRVMIFNPIKLSSEASVYKSYIGETGRRLADRFREHLRDAKKKNETNASKSFARHLIFLNTYGAKLLSADWLRQKAFFLNHEGSFGNHQEGMIT